MSSNKLSLLVNFVGVDKMSGSLRSIMSLGKKGSRSLGDLRGEGRKLEAQLRQVRRELDSASGNVTGLIDRERQLERAIENTNRDLAARKRLAVIEGDRRGMIARGEAMKSQGQKDIVQGVGLAAPIILATKAAGQFSSGMVDIQQKAGLADGETDKLAKRLIVMSRSARQMPEDMRAGLDLLLAKGGETLGLEAAEKIMGPAGRIATAYKVTIPDAASAAYASISNLKVPASETGRIFDIMASAGNQGAFEVRSMARHFPALTAQMQALGEKGAPAVADLSAALQVAMKTAGSEDEAGNNIKNLLSKINAPGTIKAFEKNFGVNLPAAMKKLTDEGYSSMEAIALVTKQATGGDMKKLGFAFEDMQARQGIMALIQNLDEYRNIREAAMKSDGTVEKAFGQRAARDAMVNWKAFLGTASALAITLGTGFLPAATDALNMVVALGNRIADWAQANPETASTLMKLVAGLALFKVGLGATRYVLGTFMGPAANVIAFFRKVEGVSKATVMLARFKSIAGTTATVAVRAFGLLRTAALFLARGIIRAGLMMLANPMVLAITALVLAIGGAAYLIYTHWDSIKSAFRTGMAYLTSVGERMLTFGRNIVQGLANGILGAGAAVWNALKSVVLSGIGKVKNLLGIKSPSRVFMQIGTHTGEGLALGLDRQGKRVSGAAGRLATGAIAAGSMAMAGPAMAAPRPASSDSAQPAPITIHIHQQPGENAQDLARRVADQLRREEQTNRRSSYEDDI
ncbi:MAG: phage tail tape measure protein [Erythrobacter sp.]|nr:phage tail tape measure protein [Erythrobacter sp.]